MHLLNDTIQCDNRLKIDLADRLGLTWYDRWVMTKKEWTFAFLGAYSLDKRLLMKNNCLLGYKYNSKTDLFMRLESDTFRRDRS